MKIEEAEAMLPNAELVRVYQSAGGSLFIGGTLPRIDVVAAMRASPVINRWAGGFSYQTEYGMMVFDADHPT